MLKKIIVVVLILIIFLIFVGCAIEDKYEHSQLITNLTIQENYVVYEFF